MKNFQRQIIIIKDDKFSLADNERPNINTFFHSNIEKRSALFNIV